VTENRYRSDVAVCARCRSIIQDSARFCPQCGVPLSQQPKLQSRVETGGQLDIGWGTVVIGDAIGEGGMGIVYRGWLYYDPKGQYAGKAAHPVAIKVLHPLLRGRERARHLFLREATALARLSHPNIVQFHALTQHLEQLALVMELVEGQPLNRLIEQHVHGSHPGGIPCMPFMRAWHYFSQLLGALAAIHELSIIHRDVKPSNVLVRTDGVVKLTDFGIARVPADEVKNTGGMAPGTGAYMAPEQVLARDLDPRTDLYSAAIVLFEMLTGITPFDSPERNEVMIRTAQVEDPPAAITRLVRQAPAVLDVLMARALAKDPMHRFASAIELGEAFRSALSIPEGVGWRAQQRLAQHAKAISQIGLPAQPAPELSAVQAEQLRTDVMRAYQA
jgi:eukaryotic-like serine/threonine-protein kinase